MLLHGLVDVPGQQDALLTEGRLVDGQDNSSEDGVVPCLEYQHFANSVDMIGADVTPLACRLYDGRRLRGNFEVGPCREFLPQKSCGFWERYLQHLG